MTQLAKKAFFFFLKWGGVEYTPNKTLLCHQAGQGLAIVLGGADGLLCDVVGGPELYPSGDHGS